jgi:hypothetical protein
VCARAVVRATARPVCLALSQALARHGVPEQILTGNGKVFTARSGRGPGPVMSGRICAGNGIRHLLTAPYSPATTGKTGRLHMTMRAEFFTPKDRMFATVEELQAALDAWAGEYNTTRPHQSCGGRPPIERFRLAGRSVTPGESAAAPEPVTAMGAAGKRPAGVSRWVNASGKISLAGFSYHVGATCAGEPAGAVVTGGLAGILYAGVVVATHAQRFREDQAGRAPLGAHRHRRVHRGRVGAAVQGREGHPRPPDPARPRPRARRARQPEGAAPPQELRHRQHRLTLVPPTGAAAQHPGPPLPCQGPAAAARRPAAALDERASTAPPARN